MYWRQGDISIKVHITILPPTFDIVFAQREALT